MVKGLCVGEKSGQGAPLGELWQHMAAAVYCVEETEHMVGSKSYESTEYKRLFQAWFKFQGDWATQNMLG